jgi:hypothetical protein
MSSPAGVPVPVPVPRRGPKLEPLLLDDDEGVVQRHPSGMLKWPVMPGGSETSTVKVVPLRDQATDAVP